MVGLVVPVLSNFTGFTSLMRTVDISVMPLVIDNWTENRGVAAAWNEGIRRGWDQEFIIIANDDVTFYPETMGRLIEGLSLYDLVSVVATDTGQSGYLEDEKPDFCCFAIKPISFINKFGWFDEKFRPAYFEDNDMYYRMELAGGRSALRLDARVDHEGSATQFKGQGPDTEDRVVSHDQFRANRDYYKTKWGGIPGEEKYDRPYNGITGKTYKDW